MTERYLACKDIIDNRPDIIHPVVRGIIEKGKDLRASGLFEERSIDCEHLKEPHLKASMEQTAS